MAADGVGAGSMKDGIFKRCACGRAFTREGWGGLEVVGIYVDESDAGNNLEMRNCTCRSTIAVKASRLT